MYFPFPLSEKIGNSTSKTITSEIHECCQGYARIEDDDKPGCNKGQCGSCVCGTLPLKPSPPSPTEVYPSDVSAHPARPNISRAPPS